MRSGRGERLARHAGNAFVLRLLTVLIGFAWATAAQAQVVLDSPILPPEPDPPDCEKVVSQYAGIDLHALFPNGIDFSNPRHYCFRNVQVEPDPATGDEFEFFESTVEGSFDDGSGPRVVELQGPVQIVVRGRGPEPDRLLADRDPLDGPVRRRRRHFPSRSA